MKNIMFNPIGFIKSPFKNLEGIPPQSIYANNKEAIIEVKKEFEMGLQNIEKFSHIIILFHFHKVKDFSLLTKTPWSDEKKGLFSTRTPRRPNPIGFTIVKLLKVKENILYVQGIDMLDGTPVLDIKPYISDLNPENCELIM